MTVILAFLSFFERDLLKPRDLRISKTAVIIREMTELRQKEVVFKGNWEGPVLFLKTMLGPAISVLLTDLGYSLENLFKLPLCTM